MDQTLAKLNEVSELWEYLNHMTGYSVRVDGDEIGDVIKAFEKEHRNRTKSEKTRFPGKEFGSR